MPDHSDPHYVKNFLPLIPCTINSNKVPSLLNILEYDCESQAAIQCPSSTRASVLMIKSKKTYFRIVSTCLSLDQPISIHLTCVSLDLLIRMAPNTY